MKPFYPVLLLCLKVLTALGQQQEEKELQFAKGQNRQALLSNHAFFSGQEPDSAFFALQHIKQARIRSVKEYNLPRNQADSVHLARQFVFNTTGAFSEVIYYDRHGAAAPFRPFITDSLGNILQSWINEGGKSTLITQNRFANGKLTCKIRPWGPHYVDSTVFIYGSTGLLAATNDYHNGQRIAVGRYGYDVAGHLVTQRNTHYVNGQLSTARNTSRQDTLTRMTHYRYDPLNRLCAAEYSEQGGSTVQTWQYKRHKIIKRTYQAGVLTRIYTTRLDRTGRVTTRSNKWGRVVRQPLRMGFWFKEIRIARYRYDRKGNCVSFTRYWYPFIYTDRETYRFDENHNMIRRTIYNLWWRVDYRQQYIYEYL